MVRLVKIFTGFFLVLLVSCNQTKTVNANANNDSIKKYLDLSSNDTFSNNQRNQYNKKAFALIDLSKNDTVTRYYLSETSFNNLKLKNWKELKKVSKIHFQKSLEKKDTLNLARYSRYEGWYYKKIKVYDSAFYFYSKAEKYYKQLKSKDEIAKTLMYKGMVQYEVSDFLGAEFTLTQAEFFNKNSNNKELSCRIFLAIGLVYGEMNENQKALKYYLKGFNLVNNYNIKDENLRGTSLNNIGNVYCKLNKKELAYKFLNEAIRCKNTKKLDSDFYGYISYNMANLKIKDKKYNEAKKLYLISMIEMEKYKVVPTIIGANIGLSDYYSLVKDTASAIIYAERAKTISEKNNLLYGVSESLQQLIKVDKKNASKNAQEYIKVNDSMNKTERLFRNKFARIVYETDEIQQEKKTSYQTKMDNFRYCCLCSINWFITFYHY